MSALEHPHMMSALELPTVEECQEFLATINRGRNAMGLPGLDVLDFDGSVPGRSDACLSATNLFREAGYDVGLDAVYPSEGRMSMPGVARALDLGPLFRLPPEILVVTAYFDAGHRTVAGLPSAHLRDLRARMVEAGVVAP